MVLFIGAWLISPSSYSRYNKCADSMIETCQASVSDAHAYALTYCSNETLIVARDRKINLARAQYEAPRWQSERNDSLCPFPNSGLDFGERERESPRDARCQIAKSTILLPAAGSIYKCRSDKHAWGKPPCWSGRLSRSAIGLADDDWIRLNDLRYLRHRRHRRESERGRQVEGEGNTWARELTRW